MSIEYCFKHDATYDTDYVCECSECEEEAIEQEEVKENRYTVTLDAYLWAKNDEEAKEKAKKIAEFLNTLEDNQAQVLSLHSTPFASLNNREVEL